MRRKLLMRLYVLTALPVSYYTVYRAAFLRGFIAGHIDAQTDALTASRFSDWRDEL